MCSGDLRAQTFSDFIKFRASENIPITEKVGGTDNQVL